MREMLSVAVFVPSAPSDSGLAIGAAWLASPPSTPNQTIAFMGPYLWDIDSLDVLKTAGGITLSVNDRNVPHNWLGSMIVAPSPGCHGHDVDYHLQSATKAFYANKDLLTDRAASVADRLKYFNMVITPVACFAAGHRAV